MNQYRDFDNDANTFSYSEGETFLSNLHAGGRHYIPIIDSGMHSYNSSPCLATNITIPIP